MAVTVLEKALSRELLDAVDGASDTAELLYTIGATGADIEDDAAVLSALKSTAPTTHNGLSRLRCGIEPLGAGRWDGSAQYGRPDNQAEDASTYSFDTAGGTPGQHTGPTAQTHTHDDHVIPSHGHPVQTTTINYTPGSTPQQVVTAVNAATGQTLPHNDVDARPRRYGVRFYIRIDNSATE